MKLKRCLVPVAVTLITALFLAGCTRRQLVPGIVAGTGGAMTTAGGIYRATLDTDEAFGDTGGEVAATTILIFGGIGLLVTGIILSITSNRCENNDDCWTGNVCELRTNTCIDSEAARQAGAETNSSEDGDDSESIDEDHEDNSSRPSGRPSENRDDTDEDQEEAFDPGSYPG